MYAGSAFVNLTSYVYLKPSLSPIWDLWSENTRQFALFIQEANLSLYEAELRESWGGGRRGGKEKLKICVEEGAREKSVFWGIPREV